ncbi:MAG: TetR/AcrR family transcriptional regulator [Candidatus Binataceae bacterium]
MTCCYQTPNLVKDKPVRDHISFQQSSPHTDAPLAKFRHRNESPQKFRPAASRTRTRKRRRPEDAASEILEAAERFLRHKPFHTMTVDDLMARTGLSRPSFYEYFRDRNDLAMKLVEKLLAETFPMSDRWFSGKGDPREDLKHGFEGLIAVYREHHHMIRALADAAMLDRHVARGYEAFLDRITKSTARRIRFEMRAGRTPALDPHEVARALILMGERYMNDKLDRDPKVDSRLLLDTLVTIWMRVLYGTAPNTA